MAESGRLDIADAEPSRNIMETLFVSSVRCRRSSSDSRPHGERFGDGLHLIHFRHRLSKNHHIEPAGGSEPSARVAGESSISPSPALPLFLLPPLAPILCIQNILEVSSCNLPLDV
ncbi:hypothetical protein BS78_10G224100 [Paspalum vaginatum]|nr:hypothetical protein BS78_10G224100 [Paspalum vaginatum]